MSKKLTGGGRVDTKGKYSTTREPLSKTQLGKLAEKLGITTKLTPEQTKTKTLALSPKAVNQAIKGARFIGGAYAGAGAIILPQLIRFIESTMDVKTKPQSGPMRFAGRGVRNPSKTSAEALGRKEVQTARPKAKPKKTLTQSQKDKIRGTFRTITVQKGDNISKIAKRAGVSQTTLKKLNPKVKNNPDLIYPGQKIRIGGK